MSDMNILSSLINDAISTQAIDMTEVGTGGGGLMPAGYAMGRMVTYIELGEHVQVIDGKPKPAAPEIRVGFKLFDMPGIPEPVYEGRFISTFDLNMSNSAKANTKKFFDRLNWANDMKHFAQGLGRAFLIPITVVKSKKTGKDGNRIDLNGILPPLDAVSKAPYPVPEVQVSDLKYFFFDKPTKETWDSLFVEGTWDDGNSKNNIQEKILTAINFPGSALEQLISGVVLPDLGAEQATTPAAPAVPDSPAPVAPAMPAAPAAPVAPVMPAMPAAPVTPQ